MPIQTGAYPHMAQTIRFSDIPSLVPLLDDEVLVRACGITPETVTHVFHDSQQTLVVAPKTKKRAIVKLHKTPLLVSTDKEYKLLETFHKTQSDLFTCPKPLSYGTSPRYLAMKRLAAPISLTKKIEDISEDEAEKIGQAFGMFNVESYKHGLIHADFHLGNVTQEDDGRLGILDLAALCNKNIECMLSYVITAHEHLAFSMAKTFSEATGERFRLEPLKTEVLYLWSKMHNNPSISKEEIKRHEKTYASFMARAKARPAYFF